MNKKIYIICLALMPLFHSCQSEKLSYEDCESLSYQKYRGLPHSGAKFNKHCSEMNIPDITSTCNAALTAMTLGVSEQELKAKWGEKILQCFHDSTIEKHLSKEVKESNE